MTDHVCDWLIMDDSDQDFTDLCSRLLKRVKKKGAGGSGDEKRPATRDEQPSSPSSRRNPPKRRKKTDRDVTKTEIKRAINGRTQPAGSGDVSQPDPEESGTGRAKDAVIRRMQRFKRASPERLLHAETERPTSTESDGNHLPTAGTQLTGKHTFLINIVNKKFNTLYIKMYLCLYILYCSDFFITKYTLLKYNSRTLVLLWHQ